MSNADANEDVQKSKSNTAATKAANEDSAASATPILQFILDHGAFFDAISKDFQLSLTAGLFLEDLTTTCSISLRELPLVIEQVMTLFFGATITKALSTQCSIIFPSFQTMQRAIQRSALVCVETSSNGCGAKRDSSEAITL